jgi:hypothetical protein
MTERIKGKPGGPFDGLEFEVAEIRREGCTKCVVKKLLGCIYGCLSEIPDKKISGNWIKPAPAQQDAQSCEWKFSNSSHETACGNSYAWDYYATDAKEFKFCPFCGKRIKGVEG